MEEAVRGSHRVHISELRGRAGYVPRTSDKADAATHCRPSTGDLRLSWQGRVVGARELLLSGDPTPPLERAGAGAGGGHSAAFSGCSLALAPTRDSADQPFLLVMLRSCALALQGQRATFPERSFPRTPSRLRGF